MANQNNYPSEITTLVNQRPSRINQFDEKLIREGQLTTLFGTDSREKLELWIYNPDGTFAMHANIPIISDELTTSTLVDNTGAYEFLNMQLAKIAKDYGLAVGRYSMVVNFFRDEVGSESSYQLYIDEISDDRTEIKITTADTTPSIQHDIYEFTEPSIPKQQAQGLMDQTFGKALDNTGLPAEVIDINDIRTRLENIISDTLERILYAGADSSLVSLFNIILNRTYSRALDNMSADISNLYIQREDFITYIKAALDTTIYEMKQRGEIDFRFDLI